MPARIVRCLAADFRAPGQQRQQAQLQGLRPITVLADAVKPRRHGAQHIDVFQGSERFDVGVPTVPGQQLAQSVVQKHPAMADVRHQRDRRQFFHSHARFIGIHHRQAQTRIVAGGLTARSDQQPVGGIASGDKVLAPAQAQIVQTGLHVRHSQAALLSGA